MQNRRQFTRIIFANSAQLSDDKSSWCVRLVDLSLKGALVSMPNDNTIKLIDNKPYTLSFQLADSDVYIKLKVNIVQLTKKDLRLRCMRMDIDSATHLRKIVELNMSDGHLLQRDLEQLSYFEH